MWQTSAYISAMRNRRLTIRHLPDVGNRNALLVSNARLGHSGPAHQAGVLNAEAFWIFEDQLRGDTVRFVVSLSARPEEQHGRTWQLLTRVSPRGYAYSVHQVFPFLEKQKQKGAPLQTVAPFLLLSNENGPARSPQGRFYALFVLHRVLHLTAHTRCNRMHIGGVFIGYFMH